MKSLFSKRSCFPSLHPRRHYGDPVNAARSVRDIAADVFKTLAPEKLTSARYMVLTFKAVLCRIIATVLSKWRSSNTKLGVFRKSFALRTPDNRDQRKGLHPDFRLLQNRAT